MMSNLRKILSQAYATTLLSILPHSKHSSGELTHGSPNPVVRDDKHPEGLGKCVYEGMGYDTSKYTYKEIEAMEEARLRDDPRFQEAREVVQSGLELAESDNSHLLGAPYLREINHQKALHDIVNGAEVVPNPLLTHDTKMVERMRFAKMVRLAAEDMGYEAPKDFKF